ncbi:MAG: YWFCY domain-containing protein [Chitinophagaceae bacterium]|nr:YWFCY domain-containing protein [Chitinophagaceae bacterium]
MSTGENEQGLRKIIDLSRLMSLVLLGLHFYFYCYNAFKQWHLVNALTGRLLLNLQNTGLFTSLSYSKSASLLFLLISLLGADGKKEPGKNPRSSISGLIFGILLFYADVLLLDLPVSMMGRAVAYMLCSVIGFLLILSFGLKLNRHIRIQFSGDIFNADNETFPQEERLLDNEYSFSFQAKYQLNGEQRCSYVNIINPFRGLLITGSPGAGKSWFIILPMIKQQLQKGYTMFIYDFKYDDLSKAAYNWLCRYEKNFVHKPFFYSINFDDLRCSHRCNPLQPEGMADITDAIESARSILLGLNRDWITKQGDFFVESPINYVTAIIWYLRKYEDGRFCTLPHVIELMQAEYKELLPVLNSQPEIEVFVNPFITAYQNKATDQLEGQVASAKIGMARLSSPQLYWVLSGNDFTLDINNPYEPKLLCLGNNPEKKTIYGAVLSLYISRLLRSINKKGKLKCSLVFDEFPTIVVNNVDDLIATARSNKVATTLAMQDFSQLKKDYGKHAEVITDICANVISGQVSGDTAKSLSERFGKILQQRETISVNRQDTSTSYAQHLENAVPASKISSLSSGQFVGVVGDNPDERISLKMFHAEIINDAVEMSKELASFKPIPQVYDITEQEIMDNYFQVKYDVRNILDKEIAALIKQQKSGNGHA